ncbi:MAG: hypothetical protein K0U86_18875 [Planctomycetes bacterium]|nr:hypothetical protein [Planctomycetota bacterium]MCH9726973.1 hypothetical protein [Planctomycetota bacterium]MCH9776614.1 hypothetical protein [Planctomycetota bacterium]MCH9792325.1 hypothetical protein [Planctomycetota bacterium]
MNSLAVYYHRQHAPIYLLLYSVAGILFCLAWFTKDEPPQPFLSLIFASVGLITSVIAASFHHLTVEDEIDRLRIRFGPLPLFQRTILYENMLSVEVDRTTILEGWGIHLSPRGGWVWNLWGRDCIVLKLKKGTLRVGTDDVENLAAFVKSRISLNEDQ